MLRLNRHLMIGCFNPRAHGARPIMPTVIINDLRVSTHAPTGGATHGAELITPFRRFQPTRPREARQKLIYSPSVSACFNPRAHGRRDVGDG